MVKAKVSIYKKIASSLAGFLGNTNAPIHEQEAMRSSAGL